MSVYACVHHCMFLPAAAVAALAVATADNKQCRAFETLWWCSTKRLHASNSHRILQTVYFMCDFFSPVFSIQLFVLCYLRDSINKWIGCSVSMCSSPKRWQIQSWAYYFQLLLGYLAADTNISQWQRKISYRCTHLCQFVDPTIIGPMR